MESYKFRAETGHDVREAMKIKPCWYCFINIEKDPHGLPDVEVEFTSTRSLQELRHIFSTIEDAHVMYQTINYSQLYMGERDCNI